MTANITADPENCRNGIDVIKAVRENTPSEVQEPADWSLSVSAGSEALIMPSQVNYAGSGYPAEFRGNIPVGSLSVIQKYLNTDFLWNKIRVRGGAYGAWSSFDSMTGDFSLVSYRDPLLAETYAAYSEIPKLLSEINLTDEQLEKLIIGVVGDLDTPQLPDAQGFTSLKRILSGIDDDYRQQYRNDVFAAGNEEFRKAGMIISGSSSKNRKVVLCSRHALEKYPELAGEFSTREI